MEQTITEKKFFYNNHIYDPLPGSLQEKLAFAEIQNGLHEQFEQSFPDKLASKTIVIIPSLTLDQQILPQRRPSYQIFRNRVFHLHQ